MWAQQGGSMPWPSGPRLRKKIESPRLGLGIINIVPFVKGLIYYKSTYLKFRYGDRKMLDTQPYPTRESTSTFCVLRLNLIKETFNIYHSRLTHTLAYI